MPHHRMTTVAMFAVTWAWTTAVADTPRKVSDFVLTTPGVVRVMRDVDNGTDASFTAEFLEPTLLAGHRVLPRRVTVGGKTKVRYWVVDSERAAMVASTMDGTAEPFVLPVPLVVLQAPVAVGTEWTLPYWPSQRFPDLMFPAISRIVDVTAQVSVPAGSFTNCVIVRTTGRAERQVGKEMAVVEFLDDSYMCPGAGNVKSVTKEAARTPSEALRMGETLFVEEQALLRMTTRKK